MENPKENVEVLSHLEKKTRNIYFLQQYERIVGHITVAPSSFLKQNETKPPKTRGRINLVKDQNGFQKSIYPENGADFALIRHLN